MRRGAHRQRRELRAVPGGKSLRPTRQRGAALLALLAVLAAGLLYVLVGRLDAAAAQRRRDAATAQALAEAKEALIGDAVAQTSLTSAGYLRLPDLGFGIGPVPSEGEAAPNFSGNAKNFSVLGKLPWRTLKLGPQHGGSAECVWYAVSGRFKKVPQTDALNWDTPGQFDIVDADANLIAGNVAALLVAPGQALDGQNRALADSTYAQCGGNYDARNYLDAFEAAHAPGGEVNYFTGSANNRVALDAANKRFVLARGEHHNDRLLFITGDEIFAALVRRGDFAARVAALLDDADLRAQAQTVAVSAGKGADHIDCDLLVASANKAFCRNWKEMLLLTDLSAPTSITIDGAAVPDCRRVLIFGGRRSDPQARLTASDKANAANYLEGANLAAFAVPVATSAGFVGTAAFDAANASADLLRCLP